MKDTVVFSFTLMLFMHSLLTSTTHSCFVCYTVFLSPLVTGSPCFIFSGGNWIKGFWGSVLFGCIAWSLRCIWVRRPADASLFMSTSALFWGLIRLRGVGKMKSVCNLIVKHSVINLFLFWSVWASCTRFLKSTFFLVSLQNNSY